MSAPDPTFQTADRIIVRIGVAIALVIFAIAIALHVMHGNTPFDVSTVVPLPEKMRAAGPMLQQVGQANAFAIGQLACLILIVIPIARVIAGSCYLASRREWIIALIGVAIVAILVTTASIDLVTPDYPHTRTTSKMP